jgi:hypothetical protein
MKSKHRSGGGAKRRGRGEAEKAWLRYRAELVELLDGAHAIVANAPVKFEFRRESVQGLLMAAYYILDVNTPFPLETDADLVRKAIWELQKALGPLGLDVDYWGKIDVWRRRDLREEDMNSLTDDL